MSKILIIKDLQKFSRSIYSVNFIQVGEQWAQNNAQEKLPENMCKYLKKKRYLKNVCTMCEKHEKDLHKFFQDHLYKSGSSGLTTMPRRNYEDGCPPNWLHLPFSFQDQIFFLRKTLAGYQNEKEKKYSLILKPFPWLEPFLFAQ